MNAATREPPKPKPTSTRIAFSLNAMKMMVAPSSPRPTVNIPEIVPAWNPVRSASR